MPGDIDQAYSAYKLQPSPETLSGVVDALHPTIHYALGSVGAADDPVVQGKAKLYAAHAVEHYDPSSGANLATHVGWQLKQLSRSARQSRSPVHIPERIQLDGYKLYQAEKQFQDENGREPDALELADHTGLSVRRIEKIRSQQMAVPSEGAVGDSLNEEGPDYDREAVEYVHTAADHTDRRILEMKTGYGGHPLMAPKDIAAKLNLTPTQLTRRSIRLTHQINELREALTKI